MLVSVRAFRGTTDLVRAACAMKAQLKPCPVGLASGSGDKAPAGDRKSYALQQKGKDQYPGGKLPPHSHQPLQPPHHRQSSGCCVCGKIQASRLTAQPTNEANSPRLYLGIDVPTLSPYNFNSNLNFMRCHPLPTFSLRVNVE
jgi:hypothetical protein